MMQLHFEVLVSNVGKGERRLVCSVEILKLEIYFISHRRPFFNWDQFKFTTWSHLISCNESVRFGRRRTQRCVSDFLLVPLLALPLLNIWYKYPTHTSGSASTLPHHHHSGSSDQSGGSFNTDLSRLFFQNSGLQNKSCRWRSMSLIGRS